MPTWIGQAARTGILTTRYPAVPATVAEVPETALALVPEHGRETLRAAVSLCPVGAISDDALDQGKCIRCARCLPVGLAFRGPVESAVRTRSELRDSGGPLQGPRPSEPATLGGFSRSIHAFLIDVGSCNACNLEVLAISNPFYDSQRLGIFFTHSPRHADVLLVVGVPTEEMVEPLRRTFDAIPDPKAVVAVGVCPISGGAFAGTPGLRPSLGDVLPVDVFVPGCPPTPIHVLDGILRAAGRARAAREV